MSWVKEAFRQGDEERRQAEAQRQDQELAQQRKATTEEAARKQATVDAKRQRDENLTLLKRLLDERGVPELLKEIQREIGGQIHSILQKEYPFYQSDYASYLLLRTDFGRTEHHSEKGYSHSTTTHDPNWDGSQTTRDVKYYSDYDLTPLSAELVSVIASRNDYKKEPHIYVGARRASYERIENQITAHPNEIGLSEVIFGLSQRRTKWEPHLELISGEPIYILLPNGSIDTKRIDSVTHGSQSIIATSNPVADGQEIQRMLAEGLRKL